MNRITIIKSTNPETVCKRYTKGPEGLKKTAVANITEGIARGVEVPDAGAMVDLLQKVTSRSDLVIVSGSWLNDDGKKFNVVDERTLATLLGKEPGKVPGGVLEHNGERISARLKRGITPSCWILLDADNPPGIPDDWARKTIAERLDMWERIVPGISSCERIELRGSSARVLNGSGSKPATHAWLRVNRPQLIGLLKAYIAVEMVNKGLSFSFKKMSRLVQGKVTGIEARSVFDLAVLDTGRLVFCAQPDIQAEGYSLDDAGITVVNEGAGNLDISWLTKPSKDDLKEYKRKTGIEMEVHVNESHGLSIHATGMLTSDTEITVRDETKPLRDWVSELKPGEKLRCEAPFRESQSEAAFIRLGDNGRPFVHDIGNGTTYLLERTLEEEVADFDVEPGFSEAPGNAAAPGDKFQWITRENGAQPVLGGAWLIKGLLPADGIGVIYGRPGSGKTFSVMDLAMHVALGLPWRGIKVKHSEVSYISPEAGRLGANRVIGWCQYHGEHWPDTFRLSPAQVNLCSTEDDAKALIADIKQNQPDCRLVVIDTLNRAMAGGDENSGEDMGRFVRLCDMIAKELECFVLVVHHSGKDASRGSRGHSSLLGAVNLEIEVNREQKQPGTIKVTKMRDGEDGAEHGFTITSVELGVDPDGEAVTTGVAIEHDAGEAKRAKAAQPSGGNQRIVARAFDQFVDDHGKPSPMGTGFPEPGSVSVVDADAFLEFAAGKITAEEPRTKRKRAREAVSGLVERRYFCLNGGALWRLT